MFARVSVYEIPEGRGHEAASSFSEALDRIAECRGFEGAYFLLGDESDRGIAVTLWSDRECMTASRITATRARTDAIESVDGGIQSVEEFEVALQRSPPEPA